MSLIAARNALVGGGVKLPYDAEVEYLESTGTQWIDTGIRATGDTLVRLKYQTPTQGGVQQGIFGARSGNPPRFSLFTGIRQNSLQCDYFTEQTLAIYADYIAEITGRDVTEIEMSNVLKINGDIYRTTTARTFTTDRTFFLFANNNAGTPQLLMVGRVWWFQIFRAGKIKADYIPVRFTNELGQSEGAMYDRASGQLFRNAGSGAFLIGPDARRKWGGHRRKCVNSRHTRFWRPSARFYARSPWKEAA